LPAVSELQRLDQLHLPPLASLSLCAPHSHDRLSCGPANPTHHRGELREDPHGGWTMRPVLLDEFSPLIFFIDR
jgi:hypothetical protein